MNKEIRKKEVHQVREIEVFVAYDGTEFRSESECESYEESAICAVSSQLKEIEKHRVNGNEIFEEANPDCAVRILVPTERHHIVLLNQFQKLVNGNLRNEVTNNEIGKHIALWSSYDGDSIWWRTMESYIEDIQKFMD